LGTLESSLINEYFESGQESINGDLKYTRGQRQAETKIRVSIIHREKLTNVNKVFELKVKWSFLLELSYDEEV
jgi:hypothetical protein